MVSNCEVAVNVGVAENGTINSPLLILEPVTPPDAVMVVELIVPTFSIVVAGTQDVLIELRQRDVAVSDRPNIEAVP
jgi:hypothetical protein